MGGIQKIEIIPRLLTLLAGRAANVLSYRSLALALKVRDKTVAGYIRLLASLFIVQLFPAWRADINARETKAAKVYVTDSGLLAHLLAADPERAATDDQITGKLLENFCAMELLRHGE